MSGRSSATRADEAADEIANDSSFASNIRSQLQQLDDEYKALEKEEDALRQALQEIQKESACLEHAIVQPSTKQKLSSVTHRAAATTTQQEIVAMQNLTNALMGNSDGDDDDNDDSHNSSDTDP